MSKTPKPEQFCEKWWFILLYKKSLEAVIISVMPAGRVQSSVSYQVWLSSLRQAMGRPDREPQSYSV